MKPYQYIIFLPITAMVLAGVYSENPETRPSQEAHQSGKNDSLFRQIIKLDSILFDAFNRRDTITFSAMFSSDLEFFHDKGGLTGYAETISFLKSTRENKSDLKRNLVAGGSEVYPIPGYGAIQTGVHEFCHTENDKKDCGRFKFVHIWKNNNYEWKVTRVISYDH